MFETVIANQKQILANQEDLRRNQESILANQEKILSALKAQEVQPLFDKSE